MADGSDQYDNAEEQLFFKRKEIMWFLGFTISAAGFVALLATGGHSIYAGLVDWIARIDRDVASNTAHSAEHERNTRHWFDQILRNRDNIRELERTLADMRAVSSTEQTPKSAVRDDALQAEIRVLERRLESLESR